MIKKKHPWEFDRLRDTFVFPLAVQAIFLFMASLVFDNGASLLLCTSAIVAYWIWGAWVILRRRHALTNADRIMIRYGFFLWFIVTILVAVGIQVALERIST
jgi:hypothetical protein